MAMLLKGAEVAKALTEELHAKTEELKKNGVEPCLAILRVGAREDDLAYERGALKRCEKVGVAVRQVVLPEDVTQEVLMENIHALGADEKVHGVLMFRPLPGHLDDEAARAALDPKKDMDGITDGSMTAAYAGTKGGYPPCTAAACVALLKHYNIPIKGKRVVVIGRSLVIGKPVSMLLLAEHATVTICHSRTASLPEVCREADILTACVGKAAMINHTYVKKDAVVIDVGINIDENGNDIEFVVGVGVANSIAKQGLLGICVDDVVEDVLFDNKHIPAKEFITDAIPKLLKKRIRIPLYKYYRAEHLLTNDGKLIKKGSAVINNYFKDKSQKSFYPSAKAYAKKENLIRTKYKTLAELIANNDEKHCFYFIPLLEQEKINIDEFTTVP